MQSVKGSYFELQGVVAVAAPWLHTFADFKSGQQAGMISKQLMQSFQGRQASLISWMLQ